MAFSVVASCLKSLNAKYSSCLNALLNGVVSIHSVHPVHSVAVDAVRAVTVGSVVKFQFLLLRNSLLRYNLSKALEAGCL